MKRNPIVIGLTGSIGMGKSTAARILRGLGLPVHDADRAVHDLLAVGGAAVKPVGKIFPASLRQTKAGASIDRKKLGQHIFGQPAALKKLEKIIHPLVRAAERDFMKAAKWDQEHAVVLDIPLLFETNGQVRCDAVICVSAPKAVQKARVLGRRGMTPAKFKSILSRQMPDAEKCALADYVVSTAHGISDTRAQLRAVIGHILDG